MHMPQPEIRQNHAGTFTMRVYVAGTAKTVARRMEVGLRTREVAEAKKRAEIVRAALARAELIHAGRTMPACRPKKIA
jgi:hypothetical protein